MQHLVRLAAVALVFSFAAHLQAQTYKVDPVHSNAVFRIKNANAAPFWGLLRAPTGSFTLAGDKSSFKIEIPVDNVYTGNEKRDAHLKSPDFFNAKQYPTITFTSKSVKKSGDKLEAAVKALNREFGRDDWKPMVYRTDSLDQRALAAHYLAADVMMVTPLRDGMNLVAKEGCLLNERNGVLILSEGAGAANQLGEDALQLHGVAHVALARREPIAGRPRPPRGHGSALRSPRALGAPPLGRREPSSRAVARSGSASAPAPSGSGGSWPRAKPGCSTVPRRLARSHTARPRSCGCCPTSG